MSGSAPNEKQEEEMSGFSLTKAVEEVSQQGYAKMAALQAKMDQLSVLQTALSDADHAGQRSSVELRTASCRLLSLEEDLRQCRFRSVALWSRCGAANVQAVALRLCADEERELAAAALAGYDAHRAKMAAHRAAVALAESRSEGHRRLEEQRRRVRELRERREAQRRDLEDPNGRAVQEVKTGQDQLKQRLVALRKAASKKREELQQEKDAHAPIRKEIQIQHRRYEAIVRRLSCQLNKVQAYYRRLSGDVNHMERRVSALRRELGPS